LYIPIFLSLLPTLLLLPPDSASRPRPARNQRSRSFSFLGTCLYLLLPVFSMNSFCPPFLKAGLQRYQSFPYRQMFSDKKFALEQPVPVQLPQSRHFAWTKKVINNQLKMQGWHSPC
jgi:hypothetical protein